jgi:phage terminase large subunit-like protein
MIKFDKRKYFYDKTAADSAIRFMETYLTFVEGDVSGKQFVLERWQKEDIIKPIFGIKHINSKLRRFREVYVEVPRKNSKSTLCAALALTFLVLDREGGKQIIGAAYGRKQAGLVFRVAKQMVKMSPKLNKLLTCYQGSIMYGFDSYQTVSKEANTGHGLNPYIVIFDELHTQKDRDLYDVLLSGMGARSQPVLICITTAGSDRSSICYDRHEYAIKVNSKQIKDDAFLGVIYSASESDDIYSIKTWRKANPNYGVSVKPEFLKREALQAKQSVAYENTFKRLYLNIWTSSIDGYISDIFWQKNSSLEIDLEGEECWAGMDFSSTSDMTSLSLFFPKHKAIRNWYWLPMEKGRDSADKNNIYYFDWLRQGLVRETEGNVIDKDVISNDVLEIFKKYRPEKVAYDPYNAVDVVSNLYMADIECQPYRQHPKDLNAPTKELFGLAMKKELNHGGDPILRWMVGNAEVFKDTNDNWKIMKNKKHPEKKVDGLVAAILAIGQWLSDVNPHENKGGSYLDNSPLKTA